MNLTHLGDALDGWKNWIIGVLVPEVEPIAVVPMFTDERPWDEPSLRVYARLLRTDVARIARRRTRFTDAGRTAYFESAGAELGDAATVFVDPDNGPWTRTRAKTLRHHYVKGAELAGLLADDAYRLLMVYRHESRNDAPEHLQACLAGLFDGDGHSAFSFGVLCGVTSLICLSRDRERLNTARWRVVKTLGSVSHNRVTPLLPARQSAPPSVP